jgi:hypothetical protein
MKKIIYLVCISVLLLPLYTVAQQVNEQMVKVGKGEVTGFCAQSAYEHSIVEEAIAQKLRDAGIKTHGKKKKLYTYRGVSLPEISPNMIDLYYKVQKKKDRSKIYFIVSKGYNNYVSTATDPVIAANVISFLSKIDASIARNAEIKQKEDDIKKADEYKKQKEKELEELKKNTNG